MKKLLFFLSGIAVSVFLFRYVRTLVNHTAVGSTEELHPGANKNRGSNMDAPATQPEVLPPTNADKKSLVDESTTGNTD